MKLKTTNSRFRLSASTLKSYSSCSWQYFAKKHLRLPDEGNDGSNRGTINHTLFECLTKRFLRSGCKKLTQSIVDAGNPFLVPVINRFLEKQFRKYQLGDFDNKDQNNRDLVATMIVMALTSDFYNEGMQTLSAEQEILIETPEYSLVGYIDKLIHDEANDKFLIIDYKSSQSIDDHKTQALCYALWCLKVRGKQSKAVFVNLRFPDEPFSCYEFSDEQLWGFEQYLVYMYGLLTNFDENKASANFAADLGYLPKGAPFGGRAQCGYSKFPGHKNKLGKEYYVCFAKFPRKYYGITNEQGDIIRTADTAEQLGWKPGDGQIVELAYKGCPKF